MINPPEKRLIELSYVYGELIGTLKYIVDVFDFNERQNEELRKVIRKFEEKFKELK